jgi:hypothetical protein
LRELNKLEFKFLKKFLKFFFNKRNISKNVFVFVKYDFFRNLIPKYSYIYLDRFMVKALWKSFFLEFNEYIRPLLHVYDLFDNFDNFDVFVDLGRCIRNQ